MDMNLVKEIAPSRINDMEEQEERIHTFIEEHMTDECGLVYSRVNARTLKPWTGQELDEFDLMPVCHSHCNDPEGYLAYEDSLMATGEYALSHIVKYEVTGDALALATASHPIYAILRVLYEAELYEKGYLPKPFGGVRTAAYSHEISPDQYIKSYVALRAYQRYSPASLKRTIDSYLVAIADYFLARNFIHPRRESMVVTPENRPHAISIYIPSLFVAYKITGENRYKNALSRFDDVLDGMLEEGKVEVNSNICSLLVEGFHLALEEGLNDARLKKIMKRLWEMNIELVSDDGFGYRTPKLSIKTSEVLRLSSLAPVVDRYFPETEAFKLGLFVLGKITNPRLMLDVIDSDPEYVPPQRRYLRESICGTSVASWLLAYRRFKQSLAKR